MFNAGDRVRKVRGINLGLTGTVEECPYKFTPAEKLMLLGFGIDYMQLQAAGVMVVTADGLAENSLGFRMINPGEQCWTLISEWERIPPPEEEKVEEEELCLTDSA